MSINTLVKSLKGLKIKKAGGKNTNINGLNHERLTDLRDRYDFVSKNEIKFHGFDKLFVQANRRKLHIYMKNINELNKKPTHGCKQPDEAYIDSIDKKVYILEKKYQSKGGSVCEKIQTGCFKKYHYQELFPNFDVDYIYCLSDWFKCNCLSELEYLKNNGIPVFWTSDEDYKEKIISHIVN